MIKVSIKLVAKNNGMSLVSLVYSKAVTLSDGSRRRSESLKLEIYTDPKNKREQKLEKPCARDPRSPVPLTLAVQNSLTL